MDGMLTIRMAVTLPTTKPRTKRVVLARSWCSREDADKELTKWFRLNEKIDFQLIRAEWVAQDLVFMGDES
jgi:hypothetical protein